MTTKHTPGPWVAVESEGGDFASAMVVLGGTGLTFELPRQRSAESDANARLIAAAPDMLNALRGALLNGPGWQEAARAAIANAEAR